MSNLSIRLTRLLPFALALALAACGGEKQAERRTQDEDPALTGALGDQLMVDPDLAGQNRGSAALGGGGPANGELPVQSRTPEAIAAARADAARLLGGTVSSAPAPRTTAAASRAAGALTAAAMGGLLPGSGVNCPGKAEYTASWAARLPAALPIYPRGAVQEAAGTDKDGCRLRVVNFITPVSIKDVIDFYYTRVRSAGYSAEYKLEGTDHVLGGTKGAAAYVIFVRNLDGGLTEVDLVASGG
jgi:hypothetical protein